MNKHNLHHSTTFDNCAMPCWNSEGCFAAAGYFFYVGVYANRFYLKTNTRNLILDKYKVYKYYGLFLKQLKTFVLLHNILVWNLIRLPGFYSWIPSDEPKSINIQMNDCRR